MHVDLDFNFLYTNLYGSACPNVRGSFKDEKHKHESRTRQPTLPNVNLA